VRLGIVEGDQLIGTDMIAAKSTSISPNSLLLSRPEKCFARKIQRKD
jgi:hypothetical protein